MTVRELLDFLTEGVETETLNPDALVLLGKTPDHTSPSAVGSYGAKRYGVAGSHTGYLVPFDEASQAYDELEGDDSIPVVVLWPLT